MKQINKSEKTFDELVDTNPTYKKVVDAVQSIRRSMTQYKPKKGGKPPKLTFAGVAEKANIERKTIYNNPQLYNWLKTQIMLQEEFKRVKSEIAVTMEITSLGNLPTTSVKKILALRERLKAEQEKNKKLVGKLAELKLEQQMYKQRIVDLEEYITKQRVQKITSI